MYINCNKRAGEREQRIRADKRAAAEDSVAVGVVQGGDFSAGDVPEELQGFQGVGELRGVRDAEPGTAPGEVPELHHLAGAQEPGLLLTAEPVRPHQAGLHAGYEINADNLRKQHNQIQFKKINTVNNKMFGFHPQATSQAEQFKRQTKSKSTQQSHSLKNIH